jgi:hypothetical protein
LVEDEAMDYEYSQDPEMVSNLNVAVSLDPNGDKKPRKIKNV